MDFKILTFSSFSDVNIINDNIDINVVFSNGDVYFATLITVQNIKQLMGDESFFWIDTMFIVNCLSKESIKKAISETIENNYFDKIFSKIGNLETLEWRVKSYHDFDSFYSNRII